jgi:ferredoxin
VVEAVAAGREAAISITRYLQGKDLTADRPLKLPGKPEYPPIPEIKAEPRAKSPTLPMTERTSFKEVEFSFSEEEALREANRCLNCGVCSECMLCVKACPADAVEHALEDEIRECRWGRLFSPPGDMIDLSKIRESSLWDGEDNYQHGVRRMLGASGGRENFTSVRRRHPHKVA